jgi:hypothetical protein
MRRKKKKPIETYESYLVRILDWKIEYSLHLDKECKFSKSPYWEYCSLGLQGEFLAPPKLKGRELRINLLAERDLDEAITTPESIDYDPKGVGSLATRGRPADVICSLPFQAFAILVPMLHAGQIKYIIFSGSATRYGNAFIRGITLMSEYDPEDY